MSQKYQLFVCCLSETNDIEGKILNLCYPWVFTHECRTSGSPRNTGNLAEMEKFLVLCNMHGSIDYQLFSSHPRINQINI